MKRYYVNFEDAFDGWGTIGFFKERCFDSLAAAKKCADRLQQRLEKNNANMGEHYGVFDTKISQEVYCARKNDHRFTPILQRVAEKLSR